MGIRFYCPNGHKLNVKAFLAGKRGICPHCDARFDIPHESQIPAGAPKIRPELTAGQPATSVAAAVGVAEAQPTLPQATPQTSATAAYDPIAEAPDAVWYVRPPAGGQFGPARGDVMRQWIAEGRISADSMVWREGWPDWKTAGPIFPGLSQAFAGAEQDMKSADAPARSITPPSLSSVENSRPAASRSRPVPPRARGNRKSIAAVVCLALVIVVLLVVLVIVLPWSN